VQEEEETRRTKDMVPQVQLGEFGSDPKGAGPADHPILMPALGYGIGTAWFRADGDASKAEALKSCIKQALDLGFRHLDDAEMYENCRITGMAVQEWLVEGDLSTESPTCRKRSDLFITQKVDNFDAKPIRDTCDMLLNKMGQDYFDLFLLHSPFDRKTNQPYAKPLKDAWREMQELVVSGKARAVGVSNFRIQDIEQVLAACWRRATGVEILRLTSVRSATRSKATRFCSRRGCGSSARRKR